MSYLNSPAARNLLDSVAPAAKPVSKADSDERIVLDAAAYTMQDVQMKAVAAVQEWSETSDLDEGEGAADRFINMLVGIADMDKDGTLSDDEQEVVQMAGNAAWDYMAGKGVAEDDLSTMFNAEDPAEANAAAGRIMEFLADGMPDGDAEATDDMSDAVFDSADGNLLDAVYKKRTVVRGGKKMRVNKRVSGHVRLSAKQKMAVRKMLRRSHGASATMHRMKSLRVRKSMGMGR